MCSVCNVCVLCVVVMVATPNPIESCHLPLSCIFSVVVMATIHYPIQSCHSHLSSIVINMAKIFSQANHYFRFVHQSGICIYVDETKNLSLKCLDEP